MQETIEIGYQVFISDGGEEFGAVRAVAPNGRPELVMQRKVIRTTLGELIVAVTDEVMPLVHDSSELHMVASWIVNDLLAHHQLRACERPRRMKQSSDKN